MTITNKTYPLLRRSEVNTAQKAAGAFYVLAGTFFSKLPADLNATAKYCFEHQSELVAAATNLALSIELSLKALAMGTGAEVKKTHNLLALFDALRPEVQNSVELVYNELRKQISATRPSATVVYITTKPIQPTEEETRNALAKYPKGHDLRSILEAEQDAFVSWRYFYEAGGGESVTCYKVEHMHMNALMNALGAQFTDGKTRRVLPGEYRGK